MIKGTNRFREQLTRQDALQSSCDHMHYHFNPVDLICRGTLDMELIPWPALCDQLSKCVNLKALYWLCQEGARRQVWTSVFCESELSTVLRTFERLEHLTVISLDEKLLGGIITTFEHLSCLELNDIEDILKRDNSPMPSLAQKADKLELTMSISKVIWQPT